MNRPLAATLACSLLAAFLPASAEPAPRRNKPARFDRSFGREDAAIKQTLRPVVAEAARSTVKILLDGRLVCLGTAVHSDGFILTKASELATSDSPSVEFPGGLRLPATVADRLDAYDLALLKVEATGLTPVQWSDAPPPVPGSFLAAVSPAGDPTAIGVASVGPRSLYQAPVGALGVQLRVRDPSAAIIEDVYKHGAAARAGLLPGDVVLTIDTEAIHDCEELIREVSRRRPGDEVALKIRRGDEELDRTVTLMDRRDFPRFDDPMVLMSGRLSNRRHGFFNAFQHDLVLQPEECGGPLVDLDGRVVGLDIARSGRTESLAIPAADLTSLLANVAHGRFTLPDLNALRDALKKAELAVLHAKDRRDSAERALERAQSLADTVRKPAPPADTTASTPAPESMPPAPTAMPPRP
jgi:serine protease Do